MHPTADVRRQQAGIWRGLCSLLAGPTLCLPLYNSQHHVATGFLYNSLILL
jgi:hypothetical protein